MKRKLLLRTSRMAVGFVLLSNLFTVSGQSKKFETRCGWYDNPTPANYSLYDRDREWIIGGQSGYQVKDFEALKNALKEEFAGVSRKLSEQLKSSGVTAIEPDEFLKLRDAAGKLRLFDVLVRFRELPLHLFAVDHEPEDEGHDRQQTAAAAQKQHQRRTHHRLLFEPFVFREYRPQ